MGSYEALANLVYRERKYPRMQYTSLMVVTVAVWKSFVGIFCDRGGGGSWSSSIPLWRNAKIPELLSLLDLEFCPQKGIKYITQLYKDGVFLSYADLHWEQNLPLVALF